VNARTNNNHQDNWDGSDRRHDSSSERLARLEVLFEALTVEFRHERDAAAVERKEMMNLMHTMRREMTHYKGIVGGISLVFSGIAIALGLAVAWFKK
jgi:hypothetical protein